MTGWRILLAFAFATGACRRAAAPMPDVFTTEVGAWHRTSVAELSPPAGVERLRAASYQGPGKLDARVYQLPSPAGALDMAQQWKPSPETVFFYNDRFFVLIRWQTADRQALHEFVGVLEKRFPGRQ
jgi:hypothetical protein